MYHRRRLEILRFLPTLSPFDISLSLGSVINSSRESRDARLSLSVIEINAAVVIASRPAVRELLFFEGEKERGRETSHNSAISTPRGHKIGVSLAVSNIGRPLHLHSYIYYARACVHTGCREIDDVPILLLSFSSNDAFETIFHCRKFESSE